MMSKVIARTLVCSRLSVASTFLVASALLIASEVRGQQVTPTRTDSVGYTMPEDSVLKVDSAYRARKAELDRWIQAERATAHPQEDFLSISAAYGAYLQILPRDLNQLFSERTLRPDPLSDRDQYATIDRAVMVAGQAQLAKTWGIYFEYDLVEKWFNTIVDSANPGPQNLNNVQEELDLTEHSFIVGAMFVLSSGRVYRLRLNGGFGGVFALTTETESGTGSDNYARSASALGYQVNFDILNDFRVAQNLSFTIDLLTRTVTTGELKTSGGQTLDAPFGVGNPSQITLKPTASNVVYGLAAGLVYYF
jgi:hypothetical protein